MSQSEDQLQQPPSKRAKTENKNKSYNGLPLHINYRILAQDHPTLRPHITTAGSIDFSDTASVRALNQALLLEYFDLHMHLPANNLCPTVANRVNYIKWIQSQLLIELPISLDNPTVGLDIGTGASCIYPLLGTRLLPGSRFIATEINTDSVQVAKMNVEANGLQDRIAVVYNANANIKLPFKEFPKDTLFTFTMCNPPFYSDPEEQQKLQQLKQTNALVHTNAQASELYTPGGELQFVLEMIKESAPQPFVVSSRVLWFTSLVGRKVTLAEIKKKAKEMGAKQVREGTLIQGRTTRWVVAWSFYDKSYFYVSAPGIGASGEMLWKWFCDQMKELGISVERVLGENKWNKCLAREMRWTRRWRRQQKLKKEQGVDNVDQDKPDTVNGSFALEFFAAIVSKDDTCFIQLCLQPEYLITNPSSSSSLASLVTILSKNATMDFSEPTK